MASQASQPTSVAPQPFRFAVAASFTADPVARVFEFWGAELNAPVEVRFAPFNQLIQTLLSPSSVFGENAHGINILLVRVEDLAHLDAEDADTAAQAAENAAELASAMRDAYERFPSPLIVCICPPSPPVAAVHAELCREVTERMNSALDEVPGVHHLSPAQIASWYPVERVYDPHADRLGRIPYTETWFAALGTAVVRYAHALTAPPYKVIALDCDNTLWQGICGEDGPAGVVLDEPRRILHERMLEQREAGLLLCLASKNNEADVVETFEAHPEFPLKMRHLTAWRLNWESKAANLASLADELSVGLDSFIFVDDNPRECAEVEDAEPEVLTLPLPENAAEIPHFLDHIWAFDHPVITEEDRNRNAYYAQSRQFGRELKGAGSLRDFVRNLGLEVRFEDVAPETLPRAAQMTQRTNQFNLTTIRRTEADLRALTEDGWRVTTVDASDRFGKYGIVGLLVWRETGAAAVEVDTFLLSCRALGRGVEHRMLAWLARQALAAGLDRIHLHVVETARNHPARRFLSDVAAAHQSEPGRYVLPASNYAALEWAVPADPVEAPVHAPNRKPSPRRRFVEYERIARSLSGAPEIVAAMRARAGGAVSARMSGTERRLAAIWSGLLHRSGIRPEDNFYDLGGHSLLAVLLILRIREEFAVELPIDDVYSAGLTLAELARKVEACEMARVSEDEYAAALAEIEAMTDEQVLAELERESAEEPA